MANGRNATQAAISVGFTPESARSRGSEFVANSNVQEIITQLAAPILQAETLTMERTLHELASVTHAKPEGEITWDHKLRAIDLSMKHLGGYEKDNLQRGESLNLQVVLVKRD